MKETIDVKAHLAQWHHYVAAHDNRALWDMLHPDCVFESPVVHTPQRGRDIVFRYLVSADKVLGGPGFTYVGQWTGADGAVLEFTNSVDGITINGIDMIRWDAEGRIVHFKVMVRPLKAVTMLHGKMAEMLAQAGSAPA